MKTSFQSSFDLLCYFDKMIFEINYSRTWQLTRTVAGALTISVF